MVCIDELIQSMKSIADIRFGEASVVVHTPGGILNQSNFTDWTALKLTSMAATQCLQPSAIPHCSESCYPDFFMCVIPNPSRPSPSLHLRPPNNDPLPLHKFPPDAPPH